jgi:hypothetical protein
MVGQGSVDRHSIDFMNYRISLSMGRPTILVHRQDIGKSIFIKNEGKIW